MDTQTRVARGAGAAPRAGRLRVGCIAAAAAEGAGAKASIPSRFETVLNHDAHESNGFGRRTYRFDEPVNDLPGPGAYGKSRTVLNKSQVQLSYSKKGSAAFASESTSAPIGNFRTPGPADYSPVTAKDVQKVTSKASSAAFSAPTAKRLLRVKPGPVGAPGPGAYRPEDAARATLPAPTGGMTSFAPRDVATASPPKSSLPGPGEFDIVTATSGFANAAKKNTNRTKHHAVPAEETRAKAQALASLPASLEQDRNVLPTVLRDVATERREQEQNVLLAPAFKPAPAKPKPRSAVFADTSLDRFGKPTVRYTAHDDAGLGPGAYEPEQKPKRMLVSSSWALSGTSRSDQKPRYAVPGPAFYSAPAQAKKVSHHMQSHDYWS